MPQAKKKRRQLKSQGTQVFNVAGDAAQPLNHLIGFALPNHPPAKPYPRKAPQISLCALGVTPERQSLVRGVSPR